MARATKKVAAKAPVEDVWQPFLADLGVKVLWIDDPAAAESMAKELAQAARDGIPVALDFETYGGLAHGATTPRLVQLYAGGDEVAVIDLAATGFEVISCLADVGCVAYGATFEARIFLDQGFEPVLHDAAIAAGCRRDRDVFLKDLATTWRRLFRRPVPTTKRTMQRSDFSDDLTPERVAYAATDAVLTLQIWQKCATEVRTKSYKIAQGAIRATAGMEMAGMPYDEPAHDAIIEEWLRVAKREVEAFVTLTDLKPAKNARGAVPIASSHAVKRYLAEMVPDELKETWPRTETGGWTLSVKELKGLRQADLPAVAQYLRATALATLLNTFGTKLRERASPYTGRIHFGFWLTGAITGRMTSSPNGQNMPGGPFRRIFRAPAGWRLISIDYAAVELRAAALLSHEDSLLDVFRHPAKLPDGTRSPDGDPHEALTRALNLDPRINPGHRLAKALNFRLLYLTGPRGFAKQSGLSVEESGKLMDRWRLVRPKLARWQRGMKRLVDRQKFTSTPLGRTVNCVIIDEKTGHRQVSAPRGVNIPIQGGCAEAIMIALRLAHERLQNSGSPARLLAAVHDEIVLEAPQEAAEEAAVIVSGAMQDAFREVFGSYPRYDDAARFVVGNAKIGETWDGPAFDLETLGEQERAQLVKGLDDLVVDQDGEGVEEQDEKSTEQVESAETTEQEVEGPLPWEDDLAVDRDHLLEKITERTLKLLRQADPRQLRLAFRQAGVELLHTADTAKLADLARRLCEPLPVDETPQHCRLGPSSAARWLNCPGSVIAIEEAPAYSSVHSHEGHKAHMALEWCLRLGVMPSQIVDPDNWPEVAPSVEVALNYIRRQVGELHVEVRFMIDHEVDLGGTADAVVVNDQEIVVVDFKHGKTAIPARDNAQLQTYAIGARQHFGERKRYRLVIIQPRAGQPTDVTEWTMTDDDLRRFGRQLLTAAKATMQDHVVRRAGDWCQWCPARATCDEYRARQAADGDAAAGRARLDRDERRRGQHAMRPAIAGQYGRMDHPRHAADLYETSPEAVEILLHHVPLPGPVLEPSAGRGAIVKELRRAGLQVKASDLHDHQAEAALGIETGVDFLSMSSMSGCRSIVMNPPFKDAESHVRHALQLLPEEGFLAVLLRMTWIAAKGRADLLRHCHAQVIAGRLKMLPPDAQDRGHNGTTDFAWFIMGRVTVRATRLIRG